MKSIILVALAFVAIAAAAPENYPKTIKESFESQPDGPYRSEFETENGIRREESAVLKDLVDADNKPVKSLEVRGSYSYTNPDGVQEIVTYLANENGFQAEGPSIPKNQ